MVWEEHAPKIVRIVCYFSVARATLALTAVERSHALIEPRPATLPPLDPARLMAERTRLLRYCIRVTGSHEAAEDMVQEALMTAWQNRERLRDSESWQA